MGNFFSRENTAVNPPQSQILGSAPDVTLAIAIDIRDSTGTVIYALTMSGLARLGPR